MIGFIYIWRDRVRNMYYVGSHSGTVDDEYVSSSRWLNGEIRYRPEDFKRRIIKVTELDKMLLEEHRYLGMIKDNEFGRKYYNLKQGAPTGTSPWNKGKTGVYSDTHRKRLSESRIGKSTTKGRKNPLSAENGKKGASKLSATATGRTRKYLEDGSWTWEYSKEKHPEVLPTILDDKA